MTDSIMQLQEPCWVLRGHPEGCHWQTRAAALECAEPEDIERLPSPCWVGECAGCGEDMGDDDQFSQVHFDSRDELADHASEYEWHLDGDDLRHFGCFESDGER